MESFENEKKMNLNTKLPESKNLCRADFDGGPVSLDEIDCGIFLGNVTAATNIETLKNLQIEYILTLDSVPLPSHIVETPFLTTKYVHISDVPKEDLLHHLDGCIDFINGALEKNKNILVHCYFGVSRSASVVIAYTMKKYKINYTQAFERVRLKRRLIGPNTGFVLQLKLYHKMGYQIDTQHPKYKIYRLRLAADKVRKAKILPSSCMDLIKPDPGVTQENPDPLVYRCRKCRRVIATKSNTIPHKKFKHLSNQQKNYQQQPEEVMMMLEQEEVVGNPENENQIDDTLTSTTIIDKIAEQIRKYSISDKSSENEEDAFCKSILFVEPIAWMKDILNQTQGRLHCPKCTQKLGNFSWINGCECPCGVQVSPAFYLVPSKVDLSHVVQNVQTTV